MTLVAFTARWRLVFDTQATGEPLPFVPVRISIGTPRYWPEAKELPAIRELMPLGLLDAGLTEHEFTRRYLERLDKIGPERVVTRLQEIADEHSWRPLALVCFEDVTAGETCHRLLAAKWISGHIGSEVPEVTWTPPGGRSRPSAQLRLVDDHIEVTGVPGPPSADRRDLDSGRPENAAGGMPVGFFQTFGKTIEPAQNSRLGIKRAAPTGTPIPSAGKMPPPLRGSDLSGRLENGPNLPKTNMVFPGNFPTLERA